MDENTLHFKITVDANGLKEADAKAQGYFNNIRKGVSDLSKHSATELQAMNSELMEVVDRFNQLARSVGISPKELRQTLSYLREIRSEQEKLASAEERRVERLANAERKLIKEQLGNIDAERRAKERKEKAEMLAEQQLSAIKIQNLQRVERLRQDGFSQFQSRITTENKRIKEQGDKAVEAFEKALGIKKKFSNSFADGAKNVFSGTNNGTFSNILGGFGGGGNIGGSIAAALDGGLSGGGGGFGAVAGGLAAGAGIGIAIAAITTFISLIKTATSLLYDWGKAGVQSAADFEQIINSVAVFSGGVNSAKKELSDLQTTVENTTGLSLEGAERGYTQLRSLGFEADNARKLIEGLGKIRITSGATEQSVERVIVNLTQLSSSTARAGQDIREIIHALPAMRQVFQEAFGTSEASKLKSLIDQDGDAFFSKLAEGMEKFKGASGGMNDAVIKLQNQWTLLGREFGKPIVPVLTEGFVELTGWIKSNKDEFKAWGLFVAGTISGLIKLVPFLASSLLTVTRGIAAAGTLGLSEVAITGVKYLKDKYKTGGDSKTSDLLDDVKVKQEEHQAAIANAMTKMEIAAEKSRERQLKSLEENFQLRNQIVENSYKIEEERIGALTTYTVSQEASKNELLSNIRKASLTAQRDNQVNLINEQIKLQEGNDEEIVKLTIKKAETINRFNTDIAVNEIKRMKEAADAERRIMEQRRAAEIEFKGIQLDAVKLGYDQMTGEINRSLQKQTIDTTAAYDKLKATTIKYYDDVRRITAERYNLQLQDKTLSDEQRRNLYEKGNLEIINLMEAQKNALLKIEDDRIAAEESKREKSLARLKAYYASLAEFISTAANSFFNPATFTSKSLDGFDDLFLQGGKRRELEAGIADAMQALDDRRKTAERGGGTDELKNSITLWVAKLKIAKEDLSEFEKSINPVYREIDRLGKSLSKSALNFKDFDRIAKLSLKERQRLEAESLSAEIKNVQRRLDAEKKRYLDGVQNDINRWKADSVKLNKLIKDGIDIDSNNDLVKLNELLISINEQKLESAKNLDWLPPTDKALELDGALQQLNLDFGNLNLKQHGEEVDQYANSIDGLTERLNLLNSGDAGAVGGVLNGTAKEILKERISLAEENIALEAQIGVVGDDSASRYRNAWLRAIYDVKRASIDAKTSQIKSQVEIANQTVFNADVAKAGILEAMAGAKGYTEIFQDAFLSINQKIGDGISSVLHKATSGLGAFGDILANVASQLLTMVTNRLMMRLLDLLLPGGNGGGGGLGIGGNSGGGGGGFSIGNIFSAVFGRGNNASAVAGGGFGSIFGGNAGGGIFNLFGGGGNRNPFATDFGFGTGARDAFTSVSSITASDTLSGQLGGLPRGVLGNLLGDAKGFKSIFGGGAGTGGFSLANLGKSFGSAAPLLGLGIGSSLGGSSVLGQILGGVGGLAGGLAVGIGTGAIGASGGVIGGLVGALGGTLAATGILAAVAAPLIIGAILLGRDKQRKADEKTRTQYLSDAFAQLDDILAKVRSHKMDGGEAISAAEAIRENYRQQASSLKDKKTRNIALKEINDRINPRIEQIRAAAAVADEDKKRFEDRIPEFATGGIVPGRFGEPRLVLAHGGEIIANPSQQTPAFLAAASSAGIPGVRGGGNGSSYGGGSNAPIHVEFVIGTEAQNQLYVNGAKSNKGYNVTIDNKNKASKYRDN